jgi:hypothetical protein
VTGLPWAKVASDLAQDPKVRRLERRLPHRDFLACMGAWLMVVTDAWRVGSREEGISAEDLAVDADLLDQLQFVRLLDADGRIPVSSWENWAAVALEEVSRRADERSRLSSLGGSARAASAARAGGRFLPSDPQPSPSRDPAGIQPSAGPAPAVHQPTPAKIEIETQKEMEKVTKGGSRGEYGGVLLTRAQLDQWSAFDAESERLGHGRLWEPVKRAWLGRSLRYPPSEKQRTILWEILDSRPMDLPRWIRSAPPAMKTSRSVIDFCLDQWHSLAREIPEEKPKAVAGISSLGEILGRVAR